MYTRWKTHMVALNKFVVPVGTWRWSRWPLQKHYLHELDRMQREMCSGFLHITRRPGEDGLDFLIRRRRAVRDGLRTSVKFSDMWVDRVRKWSGHMKRHPLHHCSRMLSWHSAAWLRSKRYEHLPTVTNMTRWSLSAGMTGTRSYRGKVQARWESGLALV